MPSRPVVEPSSTARLPTPEATPSTSRSMGSAPTAQHVDERVGRVAVVEGQFAADRRHAHRVAVARDARDDALDEPALARVGQIAEEERVHDREGPRAHREDVAQDAAHAGRGPLVGLDRRRVVVALDADRDRDAVAGVDNPGVLARARPARARLGRGQSPQVDPRGLVRAVLAPHHAVEGQFEVVGSRPSTARSSANSASVSPSARCRGSGRYSRLQTTGRRELTK